MAVSEIKPFNLNRVKKLKPWLYVELQPVWGRINPDSSPLLKAYQIYIMQKAGGIWDAEHHNSAEVINESSYLLSTRQTGTIRTIITDWIYVDCGLLFLSRVLLNPNMQRLFSHNSFKNEPLQIPDAHRYSRACAGRATATIHHEEQVWKAEK